MTVVGQAEGAVEGIALAGRVGPDVVLIDLDVPGDGLHAIEQIMATAPVPILALSPALEPGSVGATAALAAGALDVLARPERWTEAAEGRLRTHLRRIRGAEVIRHVRGGRRTGGGETGGAVVALAASAGGPGAIAEVLSGLGGLQAPVLLIQHIHTGFLDGFVQWMGRASALPVRIAQHGERVQPGMVYVGPGGVHFKLDWGRRVSLDPEPESLHRPSADQLFTSVSLHAGRSGVGALLTGMGEDGARGLLAIRRAGGHTIVQDEGTSAVYGMPAAAARLDAACEILPLPRVALALHRAVERILT